MKKCFPLIVFLFLSSFVVAQKSYNRSEKNHFLKLDSNHYLKAIYLDSAQYKGFKFQVFDENASLLSTTITDVYRDTLAHASVLHLAVDILYVQPRALIKDTRSLILGTSKENKTREDLRKGKIVPPEPKYQVGEIVNMSLINGRIVVFTKVKLKDSTVFCANFFDSTFQSTGRKILEKHAEQYKEKFWDSYFDYQFDLSPKGDKIMVVSTLFSEWFKFGACNENCHYDYDRSVVTLYDTSFKELSRDTCNTGIRREQISNIDFSFLPSGEVYGLVKYSHEGSFALRLLKHLPSQRSFAAMDLPIHELVLNDLQLAIVKDDTLKFMGAYSKKESAWYRSSQELIGIAEYDVDFRTLQVSRNHSILFSKSFIGKANKYNGKFKKRRIRKSKKLEDYELENIYPITDSTAYVLLKHGYDLLICGYNLRRGIIWHDRINLLEMRNQYDYHGDDEKYYGSHLAFPSGDKMVIYTNDYRWVYEGKKKLGVLPVSYSAPVRFDIDSTGKMLRTRINFEGRAVYSQNHYIDTAKGKVIFPCTLTIDYHKDLAEIEKKKKAEGRSYYTAADGEHARKLLFEEHLNMDLDTLVLPYKAK